MRTPFSGILTILLVGITAFVMSAFLLLQLYYAKEQMQADLKERSENVVMRLSNAINPSIWNIYRKSIDRNYSSDMASAILDAELSDPYVVAIRVYGNFGHLYMGKVKEKDGRIVQFNEARHLADLMQVDQRQVHPIKNGSMTIGRVEVFFTHEPYKTRLRQLLALEVSKIAFIALIFVIFLYVALRKALLKPMENLQVARRTFESLGEAVMVVAPDKTLIDVNPAFQDVTGYRKNEVLGKTIDLINFETGHNMTIEKIWEAVDDFSDWSGEVIGQGKDHVRFPAWLTIDAVYNSRKELISYVGVFRDISEQKKAEEVLQRAYLDLEDRIRDRTHELSLAKDEADKANSAKSDFLARMSHELRTPLNAIIGITEMVIEDVRDAGNADLIEPLQRVYGAGHHLLDLINDILDFSKIEAGKMELHGFEIDLEPFLADIHSTVEPLMARNKNRFTLSGKHAIDRMVTDPVRLKQALYNLLSNAAKFTENGHVHLDVRVERLDCCREIIFAVQDTGIGIARENLEKLFGDFSQIDIDNTRASSGTGLGLSISKHLVVMMGGDIEVTSEEGVGSTFSIRVPLDGQNAVQLDNPKKEMA